MLTLCDGRRQMSRREVLTVGGLGFGALSLPSLFAARAAAKEGPNPLSGRSVIFLFQQGGPSQFETFDPKIDAPQGIRTVTPVVQTSLPGVLFADNSTLPAPLKRFRHPNDQLVAKEAAPEIAFPADGVDVDLGATTGEDAP